MKEEQKRELSQSELETRSQRALPINSSTLGVICFGTISLSGFLLAKHSDVYALFKSALNYFSN